MNRTESTTDDTDSRSGFVERYAGRFAFFSSHPCYPCNPWLMIFVARVIVSSGIKNLSGNLPALARRELARGN
jgi:hypothetical protein